MKLIDRLRKWIAERDRRDIERDARTTPPELPPNAHERPPGMPETGARHG